MPGLSRRCARLLSRLAYALPVVVGSAGLVACTALAGIPDQDLPTKRPAKINPLPATASQGTAIRLSRAAQETSGILVAPLTPVTNQVEVRSYGLVISPSALVESRQSCVAAAARTQKTEAALKYTQQNYQRTKTLFDKDQTASQQAFQLAAGVLREDQAAAEAARQGLEAARQNARQRWGGVIADWIIENRPEYARLAKQQELLMQLTAPTGSRRFAPPPEARVQTADGSLAPAQFVSTAPRTDPRLQGQSFYYVTPSRGTTLLPGMNIVAYLPVEKPIQGVMVPSAAVVWVQGFAWAYFRQGTTEFIRRRISTQQPHPQGWFQPNTALANQWVVVQGAQLLLSEELKQEPLTSAAPQEAD